MLDFVSACISLINRKQQPKLKKNKRLIRIGVPKPFNNNLALFQDNYSVGDSLLYRKRNRKSVFQTQ